MANEYFDGFKIETDSSLLLTAKKRDDVNNMKVTVHCQQSVHLFVFFTTIVCSDWGRCFSCSATEIEFSFCRLSSIPKPRLQPELSISG